MVAGHLREKGGIYYIVLSYTDETRNGQRTCCSGLGTKRRRN